MSKYKAVKITTSDGKFDSKREYTRWCELKLLEKAGRVKDLTRQKPYTLIPAQYINKKCVERGVVYKADFVYYDNDTKETVVEDAKGCRTKEYIIKRKLMLQVYGIRIKEV